MKRVRNMRALEWVALLSTLLTLALLLGFTRSSSSQATASSVTLLDESYGLLDKVDASSRPFYLVALAQAAAKTHAPRAEEWSKLAFRESHSVSDPWDRVSAEKNALVALSEVNPKAAMELYWQLDQPVPDARGHYPEDVPADGASQVLPRYWKGTKVEGTDGTAALNEIQNLARHLGQSGEYPYIAVANVIQQLANEKNHASSINQLFGEAVQFYSDGKLKFENRDSRFLVLIEQSEPAVTDRSLMRTAVGLLVKNLRASNGINFEGEYRTSQGETVSFKDQNRAVLFKAFPTIRLVDSALANTLVREDSSLGKATKGMTYISGGVIEFPTTADESAVFHDRMRQISMFGLIQALQKKNPVEARQQAETLSDTELRFEAVSNTLPELVKVDAAAAKAIYLDHRTQLQELTEAGTKVRALVAQAKAAYYVQHDDFDAMASRAFEQGVNLYDSDYRQRPDLRVDLHQGFRELRDIVRFASSHDLDWVYRIRSLQNVELRGRLLDFSAEGLAEPKPSGPQF